MIPDDPTIDRIHDLLAQRATEGLDDSNDIELKQLLSKHPELDDDLFEQSAAVLTMAMQAPSETMPDSLRQKILGQVVLPSPKRSLKKQPRIALLTWAGWGVAAVCLFVVAWTHRPEPSVEKRRADLLSHGASRYSGGTGSTEGSVVWDSKSQAGVLEVHGLMQNDSTKFQYQLWVVDAKRPDSAPVDGGVFDVGPDGTAIVPVDAKLPVFEASVFAVTKEPAGGVVVSKGPHLIVMK